MAVTKTHPIKSTLKAAIDYICNPDKTDGKLLVSSFGCTAETADIEFAWTRRHAIDKGTNLGRHLIQAFEPGEVTPEEAHRIGMELAREVLGGKYEFVLTTHTDRDHVHNHLIFNAVSFTDHKHYHSNKRSYHEIRRTSDRICKEHGLSVIVPGRDKGKSYIEHQAEQNGTSYKAKLRSAIDRLLPGCAGLEDLLRRLQREGYELKRGKPLAYIKTESDVLKFVTALIANTKGDGKEGDEFWTKAETLLYCALVAYIVFEGPEEERNMNTLVEMINSMEVREDDETFKNAVDYMFDGLERRSPQHFAVRQYKKYKLASGKTAKSILISCGARLAPFDIPQLREIMSYDELELDRLGDEKSALFFLISDTDTTYNFLVALAFSQMFNLLCERADNTYGGRLPHHVRVLWDEAANTGQVPGLEKIVAVIRSREISLTLFYQAMSQCKALYKDHSETIMGNMDSIVFLGGREASTLKDISENWLGKATISMQTEGRSRGQSESYSQNMQRLGRELMTTSEITTMPGDKCILQLRGLPPFFSPKYDLKKHPNYKYTAEFDKKKNAFHLESLFRHRPLRLKPEDEYTVYEVDGSDTDEEADLLNFDDLDSDEFV